MTWCESGKVVARFSLWHLLVPAALSAALLAQCWCAAGSLGVTVDETCYLNLAGHIYRTRSWKPCASLGVAPLPVEAAYLLPAMVDTRPLVENVYAGRVGDPQLIGLARLVNVVLVGGTLLAVVYGWLLRRRGLLAAAAGGALVVCSPTVLAHVSLATTDAFFSTACLLTVAALARYADQPSRGRYAVLALAFGAALSAKYSALLLIPLLVAFAAGARWRPDPSAATVTRATGWVGRAAAQVVLLAAVGFTVCWAAHGFRLIPLKTTSSANTPAGSPWMTIGGTEERNKELSDLASRLLVPVPLKGFLVQTYFASTSNNVTYLSGSCSEHGWRQYYVVTLGCKSSPCELCLFSLFAAWFVWAATRWWVRRPVDRTQLIWALTAAVFLVVMSLGKKQQGVRYIFILYPLAILLTVDWVATWAWRPAARAVFSLAVVAQGVTAAQACPDYLSYFNLLVGGPANGHLWLIDSNLDWGQDLPRLREFMIRKGLDHVVLAYFGSASPVAYGIDARDWREFDPSADGEAIFIISANLRQSPPGAGLVAFKMIPPDERIGHSLFVYNLARPEVRNALTEAAR
jgi:hypothetical protein